MLYITYVWHQLFISHFSDGSAKDSGQINEVERCQAVCCMAIEPHYIITGINVYASLVNLFVIKLRFCSPYLVELLYRS
jgi:hypothetical protein